MTRDDAVSPELAAEVFERDREMLRRELFKGPFGRIYQPVWRTDRLMAVGGGRNINVCPAVLIEYGQLGLCWGRWRIEHVTKESRKGKRAEPLLARLMAICEGHAEPGMKAGHVWVTAHRAEERDYLERANATS